VSKENKPIPEKFQQYIATWKANLPDYEFMLWDFNRFDINSSQFIKEGFEARQYGFAADPMRLYALYHYGGIYLDTDVEVIKPFDESMLDTDLMMGIESTTSRWMEVGCFGAEKGHPYIKKALDYYANRPFDNSKVLPHVMYEVWQEHFANIPHSFYMPDVFTGKNFHTGLIKITPNTYTVHHYAGTWLNEAGRKYTMQRWAWFRRWGDGAVSRTLFLIFFHYRIKLQQDFFYFRQCIRKDGFFSAMKHYFKKYVLHKND
jgi:hypothetical protein